MHTQFTLPQIVSQCLRHYGVLYFHQLQELPAVQFVKMVDTFNKTVTHRLSTPYSGLVRLCQLNDKLLRYGFCPLPGSIELLKMLEFTEPITNPEWLKGYEFHLAKLREIGDKLGLELVITATTKDSE